jgi:hypothetical protein
MTQHILNALKACEVIAHALKPAIISLLLTGLAAVEAWRFLASVASGE